MVDQLSQQTLPNTMLWLGYTGLAPFVAVPLVQYFGVGEMAWLQSLLNAYAFGIISFLCGSWWRADTKAGSKTTALMLSNVLFLLGFFGFVFVPKYWPLLASILLLLLFFVEHYTPLIAGFSRSYRLMRAILSVVASITLALSFFLVPS